MFFMGAVILSTSAWKVGSLIILRASAMASLSLSRSMTSAIADDGSLAIFWRPARPVRALSCPLVSMPASIRSRPPLGLSNPRVWPVHTLKKENGSTRTRPITMRGIVSLCDLRC